MRFEPVNSWVIGRALLPKPTSTIIIPNDKEGKTRFYLIDDVSPEAAEKDYKKGDIVIAEHVYDMRIAHRCIVFKTEKVITFVRDVSLDEFVDLDGKPPNGIESPAPAAVSAQAPS